MSQPAVFLDRDGVINRKKPEGDYVKCREEFEFLPGAKEALKLLKDTGYRIIVITNQRGIARGVMTESALHEIHRYMLEELAQADAQVDAIYYCAHDDAQCNCRKPRTGLFWDAKKKFPEIDFAKSLVVGDSLKDMEAGTELSCQNILIADAVGRTSIVESARGRGIAINGQASSLYDAVVRYVNVST